jgi:hypothetical protein
MKFLDFIPNFIEITDVYKEYFPDYKEKGGYSLAAVCERLLEKKLCKKE